MPAALVTGSSRGFGFAVARALADRGWHLVVDGRDADDLREAHRRLGSGTVALAGDVTDGAHRRALADAVRAIGRLDLLVHNASTLGASPLVPLADTDLGALSRTYDVNVLAPVALTQLLLPL